MKRKSINTFIALVAVLATAVAVQSCTDSKGKSHSIPKSAEAIPVKVMPLEKSAGITVIKASGQLTTDDQTLLAFKTGGIVQAVYVKEGDRVKKGQLMATLDLTEIKAQVSQARHGFEKAQRDLQRATNLYKDSVATLEQLQNAETGLQLAKEQYDAAKFNLSFSEIHAPANGYVLKKFVNAGQVVGVGDPILLANGAAQGKWILKAAVSDKQWTALKIKDAATVTVDAFPDKKFKASVIRKSEAADALTGAFTIELEVKNEEVKFASGMFGRVEFTSSSATSWEVPYEAVLDASGDEGFVFITHDNRTAVKQPVTIESFNGTTIRISKGLENASALIISGSAYLADKSPINVIQ